MIPSRVQKCPLRVLRTSGHPLHGLSVVLEALLVIGVNCYTLRSRVGVAEWLRGRSCLFAYFAGLGVNINSIDVLIGELRLLVNLL